MAKRVIICGGTGFIGSALQKLLIKKGYEVLCVSRKPKANEYGWDQLAEILEGSEAVVNLAGRSISCKFTEENKRQILQSRLDSVKQVSEAIQKTTLKPKLWINASAIGFYGDRGDEKLTEASLPGTGFVAETAIAWEQAIHQSQANVSKKILRLGVVLAENGGALETLIKLTKFFLGSQAGDGKQWVSWIAMHDLVRMIEWCIDTQSTGTSNAVAPNPVNNHDLMVWLRGQLKRPWVPPVPAPIMRLVGKTIGPDASLVLDSVKVEATTLDGFQFEVPELAKATLSDLSDFRVEF